MSLPRRVLPGRALLVTRRTLRRHFLLRPDAALNQLFLYLVALYANKFCMQVSAIQVLSDHYHMVLTDVLGQLPNFLRELHRALALCIKSLRGWDGPVWEPGGVSAVELLTPQAAAKQMVYTWLNAVRAGLVDDPRKWPGVTSRLEDVDGPALPIKRPTSSWMNIASGLWPELLELKLVMPPILAELGIRRARQLLRSELERQLGEAKQRLRGRGWKVLGAKRCQKVSPYARATSWEPLRGRNPVLAAGGWNELLEEEIKQLRTFRAEYYEALTKWRKGKRGVLFPAGTWWMKQHHRARARRPKPDA